MGYLEEEAVRTYTRCIEDLDAGHLPAWSATPAPEIAREYWHLPGSPGDRGRPARSHKEGWGLGWRQNHCLLTGPFPSPFARSRRFARTIADTADAMMRDVLLAVRADEANHRDVNHTFSTLKQDDASNPFSH